MPILYAVCVLGLILFGFEGIERFELEHLLFLLLFGLVAGNSRSYRDTPKRAAPVQLYTPVVAPQLVTPQILATPSSNVVVAEQPLVYTNRYRS